MNQHSSRSRLRSAIALALCLGVGGLTIAGCASTATSESAGEYVDNAAITAKVKEKYLADPGIKSLKIEVATYKGVVQLTGFVESADQKARAEQLAASVQGVESVKNEIVVLRKGETAGQYMDSAAITAKVKAKIAEDPHLSAFAIEVETQRGIVQLSGFVDSSAQRTAAGRIARSVEGVKSVKNSLTVKPRS